MRRARNTRRASLFLKGEFSCLQVVNLDNLFASLLECSMYISGTRGRIVDDIEFSSGFYIDSRSSISDSEDN